MRYTFKQVEDVNPKLFRWYMYTRDQHIAWLFGLEIKH